MTSSTTIESSPAQAQPAEAVRSITAGFGPKLVLASGSPRRLALLQQGGVELLVFEPELDAADFMGARVVRDLREFIDASDVIIANRMTEELDPVADKVYTRDLFGRDS